MTPAVIAKIISMQPNFTVSENEIAQYVMNHTDSIITSTISVIAKETGKPVYKPANPFLVTPLGIALNCSA